MQGTSPPAATDMLSRSNSNAGARLRRAKSTSSAHVPSSGHQRSSASIDPFVVRQHAETAALEAFQRAKQLEESSGLHANRLVPPKLQRRRSQATGRTEGSHFEDARLGRRRSTSKKSETRAPKLARLARVPSEVPTSDNSDGEVVITRKRSVIEPRTVPRYSLHDSSLISSSTRNERRKLQAAYTDGSPAPRSAAASRRGYDVDLPTSTAHRPLGYESPDMLGADQEHTKRSPKPSVCDSSIDDETMNIAQNQHPQGSHTKKLRQRASQVFAAFQKHRAATSHQSDDHSFDTSLPPFNHAVGGMPPPPLSPLPVYTAPEFTATHEKKNRTFSDSLKGRFKKVFRRATRVPTVIPAQHVEAAHPHYRAVTPISMPTVRPEEQEDPFMTRIATHDSHLAAPDPYVTTESRQSSGEQSAAKSRVTSWTNSTVAGTWSTRDVVDAYDTADEQGRLTRSGSPSTLRNAKSFFGRTSRNRLRHVSKLDPPGSEESAGLYSALQERIQPTDSSSQAAVSDAETQSVRLASALDCLPSRRRTDSKVSSRGGWQSATIRSVTPDPTFYKLDIPSPVKEVYSPDATPGRCPRHDQLRQDSPGSQLQRRPAMKAPTPSKEQIERRIERSKNRWQSPLDELSPSVLRSSRYAAEDNPYEMRSLSRTLQQAIFNDLPHHAKVGEQQLASGRLDVLSPSLYSCGTDGEWPRPETPAAASGMVVTITGREVKSYAISPSKADQPIERAIHASQEWQRWLSDEMNGWDGPSVAQDVMLPKHTGKKNPPATIDTAMQQNLPQRVGSANAAEQRPSSVSPTFGVPPTQTKHKEQRPRLSSRLSSYMNDRYPMINTGHTTSDQSERKSMVSSCANSRPGTAESIVSPSTAQGRKGSSDSRSLKSALARQQVVTKPRSMAQLVPSARRCPSEEKEVATDLPTEETDVQSDCPPSAKIDAVEAKSVPVKRLKSAFDLRASYKSKTSSIVRPLEVRCKATNTSLTPDMLEDSTILHISAGPYASASHANDKENVHPAPEAIALPALSSSEWLAAGSNKKREGQGLMSVNSVHRNRSAGRYSPAKSTTGTPTSGVSIGPGDGAGGSPGHRLAMSWLDGKRSKENSPAFI